MEAKRKSKKIRTQENNGKKETLENKKKRKQGGLFILFRLSPLVFLFFFLFVIQIMPGGIISAKLALKVNAVSFGRISIRIENECEGLC